jgi:tetratricopeptide (TPR) repeat protein
MGVDERNDHSFRIPRPDLSVGTDNPNACNQCHKDKGAQWANDAMVQWYGKVPVGKQNFAHALDALHTSSEKAPQFLYDVLMSNQPNIAKATAVAYLGNYPSQQTYTTTLQMLRNSDSDIRLSALQALEAFPLQMRIQETFKMLSDEAKVIRIEAAKQLSAIPQGEMDEPTRKTFSEGIEEYKHSLLFNADRAESQVALGALYANLGENEKAVSAFDEALRIQPRYIPAYINAAYFYQNTNDAKAKEILVQGVKLLPNEPALHHALGLWYIRHHEGQKAVESLQRAADLDKENAQYQYVYAVAIGDTNPKAAIEVLKNSLKHHSGDIQTLFALSHYSTQLGSIQEAKMYQEKAEKLVNFLPQR